MYVEPLITRSKDDSTNSRRVVFSYLQNKYALKELFGVVAEKVADRPGGYTRIIKLGVRKGDAAQIAFIELVDFDRTWPRPLRLPRRHAVAASRLLPRLLQQKLPPLRHPELKSLRPNNPEHDFIFIIKARRYNAGGLFLFIIHNS